MSIQYDSRNRTLTLTSPEDFKAKEDLNRYTAAQTVIFGRDITIIPEGVNEIFRKFENLTLIQGNEVVTIEDNAFQSCKNLSTVRLPRVTTIGMEAFSDCIQLRTVYMTNATTIEVCAFSRCYQLQNIYFPIALTIEEGAFSECSSLSDVRLPIATTIGENAFYLCERLKKIIAPKTKTVGYGAFRECEFLKEVKFALGCNVDRSAFNGTFFVLNREGIPILIKQEDETASASGIIPQFDEITSTLTLSNNYDFEEIKENLTILRKYAKTVILEEGITIIPASAFREWYGLEKVEGANVRYIGWGAFMDSTVREINFPKVTSIGIYAFRNCSGLGKIELPNLIEIDRCAFRFSRIEAIIAPKVEYVKDLAFEDCTDLKEAKFSSSAYIDSDAFKGLEDEQYKLVLGEPSEETSTEPKPALTAEETVGPKLEGDTLTLSSIDDFEKVEKNLDKFKTAKKVIFGKYITFIPDGVYKIFEQFENLESIQGDEVVTVGYDAFSNCEKLKTVSLPKLTKIGDSAFSGCIQLEEIELPNATMVGSGAFGGCHKLKNIDLPKAVIIAKRAFYDCKQLEKVELPSVVVIRECAFESCTNLTTLIAPKTKVIEFRAFSECRNLEEVKFAPGCDVTPLNFARTNVILGEGGIWVSKIKHNAKLKVKVKARAEAAAKAKAAAETIGPRLERDTLILSSSYDFKRVEENLEQFKTAKKVIFGKYITIIPSNLGDLLGKLGNVESIQGDEVVTVENGAFKACVKLKTASFLKVTVIGDNAFSDCKQLETVKFPNAVFTGENGFKNCYQLKNIEFPNAIRIEKMLLKIVTN